jgi:hypothetical protein
MELRSLSLTALALLVMATATGSSHEEGFRPPPAPPPSGPLMWTAESVSSPGGTWDSYTATAAAWTEGGYTDWRLPTIAELQAAVTDNDPATFGYWAPNSSSRPWTSETQGRNYAFTVRIVTDENGYPIPSQSGEVVRVLRGSNLRAKFVRP